MVGIFKVNISCVWIKSWILFNLIQSYEIHRKIILTNYWKNSISHSKNRIKKRFHIHPFCHVRRIWFASPIILYVARPSRLQWFSDLPRYCDVPARMSPPPWFPPSATDPCDKDSQITPPSRLSYPRWWNQADRQDEAATLRWRCKTWEPRQWIRSILHRRHGCYDHHDKYGWQPTLCWKMDWHHQERWDGPADIKLSQQFILLLWNKLFFPELE